MFWWCEMRGVSVARRQIQRLMSVSAYASECHWLWYRTTRRCPTGLSAVARHRSADTRVSDTVHTKTTSLSCIETFARYSNTVFPMGVCHLPPQTLIRAFAAPVCQIPLRKMHSRRSNPKIHGEAHKRWSIPTPTCRKNARKTRIIQHSHECKDPRRQCFVLWPWVLTLCPQNKWVSRTHHGTK